MSDSLSLYEQKARELGTEHGKNAASWVFDGNTDQSIYRRFLKGIEEGDPEVLDSVRTPNLGGEFQDDYTEDKLAADLDDYDEDIRDYDEVTDEAWNRICTQYLDAASTEFWNDIETQCRRQLDKESL